MKEDKTPKLTQLANHLADRINRGKDIEAERIQKEAYFRNTLGSRLKTPKKQLGK